MSDDDRLYGLPGDEYLERDPRDVWERWWDNGCEGAAAIEEWSTGGWDLKIPHGSIIAERVADDAQDECAFTDAGEAVGNAAGDSEVVAAFEAARQLLIKKAEARWLFADKLLRTGTISTALTDNGAEMVLIWNEAK